MFAFFKQRPKIKIGYNRFLDPIFVFYCKNNPELKNNGWNDWAPPTNDVVLKRIEEYKKEWNKLEKKIIVGLYSITGLSFKRNIIDVHIVSGNPRQFSWPIVIKSGFTSSDFVDTLLHELIHVLFSDNKVTIYPKFLQIKFPIETKTVKNHVVLHAILEHMYKNILKDRTRIEKIKMHNKNHKTGEYTRAWEIVDSVGFEKIIKEFRKGRNSTEQSEKKTTEF